MQDKDKRKGKDKSQIKVQDLKPAKDPKGGLPPGPCRRGIKYQVTKFPGV